MRRTSIRLRPNLTLSLGFRDEFTTGWNEVDGRASTYTYPNGVIASQPTVGSSAFTVNNGKFLPQPRLGLAWSTRGDKHKTAVRAGFGIFHDLQDALGYRTDQNAPFNPTYSVPNVAVGPAPAVTTRRFRPRPRNWCRAAFSPISRRRRSSRGRCGSITN